ncbi:putative Calcium-binding EF-hand family protein [Hibiscus syriacus]|uniref:Calcium-binding EF-hand family protein n=1 Tax=Hibiscus syriacus TaxID=106335 RepID=A0A6A2XJK5_HIBSY|nr:putative Calcium-binding EF-hand family protein [Hibiscus syriacus]
MLGLGGDASVPKCIDKYCQRSTWPKRASVRITEDQLRGIFIRCDTNKDGLLSKEELREAFACLGSRMPGVRAWLALQHADVNGDGFINEAEFDKLVKYTLKSGYKIN